MKTWKKVVLGVLAVLGAAIAIVLILAAMQPDTYAVERSRVIHAPPERIAPLLTDLRQWITWNPWDELEPTSHKEYSDPASGVGAWYTWEGEVVGAGRMEIASISASEVVYDLTFTAPFEDEGVVTITMTPEGDGTRVTWAMTGNQEHLMGKIISLFMDMDAMLGADFERGLTNLEREVAEAPAS